NAALLSRAQVLILERLSGEALGALLARAETLQGPLPVTNEARAALIASLIAGPALAQDGGASLPVFPTPSDRLPQVREREAPTVRQNTLPGINVVPRSVWGTRPRPRPVEGDALVAAPEQPEAAAESVAAVVDDLLPGLTDRVAQGAVAPAPLVPGAADATPATLPAPAPGPV
ncbi:MAG: hypothetical protein AAFU61_18240, partial [Pseudomonadota bacterium]